MRRMNGMTKRETSKSERDESVSKRTENLPDLDAITRALSGLFSSPKLRSRAHFRYPFDGKLSEFEQALDAIGGPNKEQERWVRRLRRPGLINDWQMNDSKTAVHPRISKRTGNFDRRLGLRGVWNDRNQPNWCSCPDRAKIH